MDKRATLLVIDDDERLSSALRIYMSRQGYRVLCATDALAGLQLLYDQRPDLVILDIMMPNMDGWEACRRIREITRTPIIMLTARSQESDRITGLELGADDYVVKPFSMRELAARIDAVLRRVRLTADTTSTDRYVGHNLIIDAAKREVAHRGMPVDLTATEMRFLLYLLENANHVLTHQQILTHVWGAEYANETEYTKLFAWRLRQKIEDDPKLPRRIVTERGIGYRFCTD